MRMIVMNVYINVITYAMIYIYIYTMIYYHEIYVSMIDDAVISDSVGNEERPVMVVVLQAMRG